jgi:hypothetical protein
VKTLRTMPGSWPSTLLLCVRAITRRKSDFVTLNVEQHCIMRFIVKEKLKAGEILLRLIAHNGEETLSHASVCSW